MVRESHRTKTPDPFVSTGPVVGLQALTFFLLFDDACFPAKVIRDQPKLFKGGVEVGEDSRPTINGS
jgi:hypothetical protein